jgi:hypothetical protein
MTTALLDSSASEPRARPDGTDARARLRVGRRVRRWLGQLVDIGVELVEHLRTIPGHRRRDPSGKRTIDLDAAWDLMARAMRWTHALRARLKAEAEAAKDALKRENRWREPPERLNDWDEGGDDLDWLDGTLRRLRKPPAEAAAPDDCIDGVPTAEVVERICIDLGIVAVLFRSAALGERIAAVAAEAHALLGGAGAPWTAPPIPPAEHPAAGEQQARWQAIARHFLAPVGVPISAPLAAPDTG